MSLASGTRLGVYEILAKIGKGGMGDVYRARDTRLGRDVAIKVLPSALAEDDERRARFEREAKTVAALNHPNIVTVHSVEEADGLHFITMELVRGKTLTQLLPRDGFSMEEFFEIAIPLTDAVREAHELGITHRDLKPDNVMVTDDGRLKILDFGLAKLTPTHAASGISDLETLNATREGWIVGTVGYMSPEQAEGKAVDHRTDVFALGVVFYQMITGRPPFTGDSVAALVSSILRDRPSSLSDVKPAVPRDLSRIIRRCLEKDPLRRFQAALDLRNELEDCREEMLSGIGESTMPNARARLRTLPLLAVAIVAGTLGFALSRLFEAGAVSSLPKFARPRQITTAVGAEAYPSWSPDGGRVAYTALGSGDNWDIWVSQIAGGPPVNLTSNFEGKDLHPSWSPDGSQIAFSSGREGGGCFVMPALGGPARKISGFGIDVERGHPAWSGTGDEIACVGGDDFIRITNVSSGEFRDRKLPNLAGEVFDLSWSSDGRLFAFVEAPSYQAPATRLWLLDAMDESDPTPLTDGNSNVWGPSFRDDGHVYFVSNAGGVLDLWRQRLREDGRTDGSPEALTVALGLHARAVFSPDATRLAYARGRIVSNVWRVPILTDRPASWTDAVVLTSDQAYIDSIDVCRQTKKLVLSSDRAGSLDLWTVAIESRELRQLTSERTSSDWGPAWSPDCSEIAFHSDRAGSRDIWIAPIAPGPPRQLTDRTENELDPRWSPDGTRLAFSSGPAPGKTWAVTVDGGEPLVLVEEGDRPDDWSPDGEWVLFQSTEDGKRWRRSLEKQVNENLGFESRLARWSPEGAHIYYLGPGEGDIWSYSVADGASRRVTDLGGRPGKMSPYALATDGEFLYFAWRLDESDIWVMDVVEE